MKNTAAWCPNWHRAPISKTLYRWSTPPSDGPGISKADLSAIAFTRAYRSYRLAPGRHKLRQGAVARAAHTYCRCQPPARSRTLALRAQGEADRVPQFPYICLLISGGNSQLIHVRGYNDMEILGRTIDDAAGEAFDKCAKVMGLPYPGGPHIDRLAAEGDHKRFAFAKPHIPGLDYSFSGLKTSFLYTLRDGLKTDADFIERNKTDLAASLPGHHNSNSARQARQSRKADRRTHRSNRRRRIGKLRRACRRRRLLQPTRPRGIHPRARIHYRQRCHGSYCRLFQISRRSILPLRRSSIR